MNDLLQRFTPSMPWLSGYGRSEARGDLAAGLSVGVMLIPQGMAYAMLGGLPPIYGLYASLVPLLMYPLFGTARQLAVGIVALDMLIVAAGLGAIAEPGTERYVALAVLLAALVGVLQLVMSAARLGFVADLLSRPVIAGFTSAAALVIAASQVGTLLGLDVERSEYVHVIAWEVGQRIADVDPLTLGVGGGCVVLLLALRRFAPRVPGPLVVVVLATAAVWIFRWGEAGLAVTGAVPAGLPAPALPEVSLADARTLLPIAVTLALIQFMSVISLGRALSARHRYTIRPNRELLGIGAANLAGSLFRGIPVSASFSRSAVNDEAGACTPLANVVAAVLVGLTLLFLTPLFEFLPRTALSAIIIVSALGLIDVGELRTLFGTKRRDGAVALLTAAATLLIGVQEGIIVGVAASAVVVLYRVSRPHVAELGLLPGTHVFRDRGRFEDAEAVESVLVLRVDAAFSFFNAAYFRDYILRKSRQGSDVRAVVIDGSGINDLDTTAIEALRELVGTLKEWEIAFYLAGLKGPVRDILARSELSDALDSSCFQLTPYHAVRSVLERWDEAEGTERVQDYEARAEEDSADDDSEPAEDVRLT